MSAHDIPDLVPIIAAVASVAEGRSVIEDCARLRLKESDRLETVTSTLVQLGAHVAIKGDDLVIDGQPELAGGTVDACNDHRIAMMASIVRHALCGRCGYHRSSSGEEILSALL